MTEEQLTKGLEIKKEMDKISTLLKYARNYNMSISIENPSEGNHHMEFFTLKNGSEKLKSLIIHYIECRYSELKEQLENL